MHTFRLRASSSCHPVKMWNFFVPSHFDRRRSASPTRPIEADPNDVTYGIELARIFCRSGRLARAVVMRPAKYLEVSRNLWILSVCSAQTSSSKNPWRYPWMHDGFPIETECRPAWTKVYGHEMSCHPRTLQTTYSLSATRATRRTELDRTRSSPAARSNVGQPQATLMAAISPCF